MAHDILDNFLYLNLFFWQIGDVVTAVNGLNVEAETVETVTALLRGSMGSQVKEAVIGQLGQRFKFVIICCCKDGFVFLKDRFN